MPETAAATTAQETPADSAAAPQSGDGAAGAASGASATTGAATEGQSAAAPSPISYESFNLPAGLTLEAEAMGAVSSLFSELKLPQDQAQRVIDQLVGIGPKLLKGEVEKLLLAEHEAQTEAWAKEARESTDIGGAQYDAAVAEAQTAIGRFGTPGFKALLETMGLGNHPEVIRTFRGIGKEISEGSHVSSQGGSQQGNPLETLYNHPSSKAQLKYA